MSRADYCPIGNVPCQSLCETPCNARKPLTNEQIDELANDGCRNAAGGIYATRVYEFARAIESAHGIAPAGGIGGEL